MKTPIISDLKARQISSDWLKGGSPLHVLSSTGAIVAGVMQEIDENMDYLQGKVGSEYQDSDNYTGYTKQDYIDLENLGLYCMEKNYRGEQKGWNSLNWD